MKIVIKQWNLENGQSKKKINVIKAEACKVEYQCGNALFFYDKNGEEIGIPINPSDKIKIEDAE